MLPSMCLMPLISPDMGHLGGDRGRAWHSGVHITRNGTEKGKFRKALTLSSKNRYYKDMN